MARLDTTIHRQVSMRDALSKRQMIKSKSLHLPSAFGEFHKDRQINGATVIGKNVKE